MLLRFINPIALTHDVRVQVISPLPLEYMAVYEAKAKNVDALLATGFWQEVGDDVDDDVVVANAEPWEVFTAVRQIDEELARSIWAAGFSSFKQVREAVDANGIAVLTDLPGIGEKRAMLIYEHSREG